MRQAATLRLDDDARCEVGPLAQCLADDPFGARVDVEGCGVDQADAFLERSPNRAQRHFLVKVARGRAVYGGAQSDIRGADPNRGDLNPGLAQGFARDLARVAVPCHVAPLSSLSIAGSRASAP